MPIQIERRSGLSRREFDEEYVARSQPVILVDAIDHWPARHKWNLAWFAGRFADKVVHFDRKDWRVGDIIETLMHADAGNGPMPYLKEVKLDEQFPELWEDVGALELAAGNRLNHRLLPPAMRIDRGTVAVFIGASGSGFRKLHWDYSHLHVFISQVHGPKDAILFPPSDTPFLYQNPEYENLSLIPDPHDVDLGMFPDFAGADATRLTIAEGETLFLPAGWWHATSINAPSIAIAESTLDAFNWDVRTRWLRDHQARERVPLPRRLATRLHLAAIRPFL
jgi:hypothetical protein